MNGNINTHLFTEYSARLKTFCSISDGIAERLLLSSPQTGERRAGAISKGIGAGGSAESQACFQSFWFAVFYAAETKNDKSNIMQ
jgi:hypothetical protein